MAQLFCRASGHLGEAFLKLTGGGSSEYEQGACKGDINPAPAIGPLPIRHLARLEWIKLRPLRSASDQIQ
jgi:hypothetical protein